MTYHRGQNAKAVVAREVVARRVLADGVVRLKALADLAGVSKPLMSTVLDEMTKAGELVEEASKGTTSRAWRRGPNFVPPPPRRAARPVLAAHVGAHLGGRR